MSTVAEQGLEKKIELLKRENELLRSLNDTNDKIISNLQKLVLIQKKEIERYNGLLTEFKLALHNGTLR